MAYYSTNTCITVLATKSVSNNCPHAHYKYDVCAVYIVVWRIGTLAAAEIKSELQGHGNTETGPLLLYHVPLSVSNLNSRRAVAKSTYK
jgi:hypothetical protein